MLHLEGVPLAQLAFELGTPLYVLSESRIRDNYSRLQRAFEKCYDNVRIYYAAKANSNLSVLAIMREMGSFIDAVSSGEIYLALKSGFDPERILYTGTSVGPEELDYALKSNVVVNVDSISQMRDLLGKSRPAIVSVRLNPGVGAGHHSHVVTGSRDTKFGLTQADTNAAYSMARDAGVERFGIQMHIGSGILNFDPYINAMENLLKTARDINRNIGINFEFIDLGGGFGIPYRPEEKELNIEAIAHSLTALFKRRLAEYGLAESAFCIEPGRYIVGDAGLLLTRVNTVKSTGNKEFIGVDAGFNTLIRPAMYDAYHEIIPANTRRAPTEKVYDVVGPLCESGDFLARDRKLQETKVGDLLGILNAGAYGFSMSSQYNSRPRPAEILVKDTVYSVVREPENFETLTIGQRIPERLQAERNGRRQSMPTILSDLPSSGSPQA